MQKSNKLILNFMVILMIFLIITGCSKKESKESPIQPPGIPSEVKVVAADSQLSVSWNAVSGASMYIIYLSNQNDLQFAKQYMITSETMYVLTGLDNGTTYYIWIKAKNGAGTSDFSEVASGTPMAPITTPYAPNSFTLTPSTESITVSWSAVEGATAYEVWYGTQSDNSQAIKFADITDSLTCIISGLSEGVTYYVWLKAKNEAGTSNFSYPQYTTTKASGSITGLVNSEDSFTITVPELDLILNYSYSSYFTIQDLSPGTYHVRFDRWGHEPIIKEVNINKQQVNLGTLSFDNKIPDDKTFVDENVYDNSAKMYYGYKFTIAENQTIQFEVYTNYINSVARLSKLSGQNEEIETAIWRETQQWYEGGMYRNKSFDLEKGRYKVYATPSNGAYMKLRYKKYVGVPQVNLSKSWCKSQGYDQVSINCSDQTLGIESVKFAITNSLTKPNDDEFTTIPAVTAIEFNKIGTWFLHINCTNNLDKTTRYVLAGPYIIY